MSTNLSDTEKAAKLHGDAARYMMKFINNESDREFLDFVSNVSQPSRLKSVALMYRHGLYNACVARLESIKRTEELEKDSKRLDFLASYGSVCAGMMWRDQTARFMWHTGYDDYPPIRDMIDSEMESMPSAAVPKGGEE